jgi:hypothetical protein
LIELIRLPEVQSILSILEKNPVLPVSLERRRRDPVQEPSIEVCSTLCPGHRLIRPEGDVERFEAEISFIDSLKNL